MKTTLPATLAFAMALSAAPVLAAAPWAPGVNVRWDRCFADDGVSNKTFACNTNVGSQQLVGSFELAQTLPQVVTAQLVLDIRAASASLPAWWEMSAFGTCRRTALDFSPEADPVTPTCVDWSTEPTGGGIAAYSIGSQGPVHVRINATIAVRTIDAATLFAGQEYFLFRLLISHEKTVGTGACTGCDVPVCLFLSSVSLYQRGANAAAIHLDRGANYLGSQYATWQSGYPVDVQRVCEPGTACAQHYASFGCVLATPTAQRRSTWGQVKAMFR